MSATNATTNYSLPLFIGTDKPAWLVDWNSAMTDIDGQMKINATAIQANATSISGLSTTVSAHTTSISTISGEISTLSTGLNSAQGAINTIQSLIGNGEPTTTDKTLIGAINEIYGMITGGGDAITANNVVYNNTTSGLTATDVQAAIDELANGSGGNVAADDVSFDNTASGLSATNVQDAIEEVAAGAQNHVLLWTNSDPTVNFTAGDVTVANANQYKYFMIEAYLQASANPTVLTFTISNTSTIQLISASYGASSGVTCIERNVTVSGTTFTFSDGKKTTGTTAAATNNAEVIPYKIYGMN